MVSLGLSRTTRISLLLAIDVVFFFVEIIVGYAVGSLALVADSFHMLNDVASLIIALYAIKLTAQSTPDTRYSYGWHRAEILAALVNGVFLLALCFSITMEALQRFFTAPEISNPKLVVIVGSLGLASNILGLFMFHEHGHSHGHSHESSANSRAPSIASSSAEATVQAPTPVPSDRPRRTPRRSISRLSRDRSDSYSSLYGHPAVTRASMVQTAAELTLAGSPTPNDHHRRSGSISRPSFDESRSMEPPVPKAVDIEDDESTIEPTPDVHPAPGANEQTPLLHEQEHSHGHSHSHGSMNMRAILLHVLGDALGNVGVIATGLIIWLSSWSLKFYCDPVISLIITVIICHSALPLVRSTSAILLQGVPSEVSFEDVREGILMVEGVLSVHELHIWQLSESKIIASVHVTASRKLDFMPVASDIRRVLHSHGIHSSTIQPEYHPSRGGPPDEALKTSANTNCLIACPPEHDCNADQTCCPGNNGSSPEP
ncbi:cation efflux protein [Amylostereum chailletii]|nr:cation efflux protein [Amylostereum chailletii]